MYQPVDFILDATDKVRTWNDAHRFARDAWLANEDCRIVRVRALRKWNDGSRAVDWIEIVPGGGERIYRRLACTA